MDKVINSKSHQNRKSRSLPPPPSPLGHKSRISKSTKKPPIKISKPNLPSLPNPELSKCSSSGNTQMLATLPVEKVEVEFDEQQNELSQNSELSITTSYKSKLLFESESVDGSDSVDDIKLLERILHIENSPLPNYESPIQKESAGIGNRKESKNLGSLHLNKKTNSRRSTSDSSRMYRRPPGRYKVKVLESPPVKKVKKPSPKIVDPNTPYLKGERIDVDGKLKINGKSYDTYITHPQYQLLKEFYVPGLIATRLELSKVRAKYRRPRSTDSGIFRQSSSSTKLEPKRTRSSKSETSILIKQKQHHSSIYQQTDTQERNDEETQTEERKRTVEFDLNTKIREFDQSSSSQSLNSDLTSSDISTEELKEQEEQILWEEKSASALRMIGAILSAEQATSNSLTSNTMKNIINSLSQEEKEGIMEFIQIRKNSEDEKLDESELLIRLMDTYGTAYDFILGHIKAADAYYRKFPPEEIPRTASEEFDVNWPTNQIEGFGKMATGLEGVDNEMQFSYSKSGNYLRFSPEINDNQVKAELYGNHNQELTQKIRIKDFSIAIKYGANGVSTILSASRKKEQSVLISTGNLLLMHNQHTTLTESRIVSAKYYMNRVLEQLTTLVELFMSGKYAKALRPSTKFITSKTYGKFREINVFSGIILQLSESLALATKKMLESIKEIMRMDKRTFPGVIEKEQETDPIFSSSITIIDQPEIISRDIEVPVPLTSLVPSNEALEYLISAFNDIDHLIQTGSVSLRGLNSKEFKIKPKYHKTIVSFMEAGTQLERGHDLDFGAVLLGFVLDTYLLLHYQIDNLDLQQRGKIVQNFHQLYHCIQDLRKMSKKSCLLSSYACSKSMQSLHRFRDMNEPGIGCWGIFWGIRERKRKKNSLKIEDKKALQDVSVDGNSMEQDNKRLNQMLAAVSNESSISSTIF